MGTIEEGAVIDPVEAECWTMYGSGVLTGDPREDWKTMSNDPNSKQFGECLDKGYGPRVKEDEDKCTGLGFADKLLCKIQENVFGSVTSFFKTLFGDVWTFWWTAQKECWGYVWYLVEYHVLGMQVVAPKVDRPVLYWLLWAGTTAVVVSVGFIVLFFGSSIISNLFTIGSLVWSAVKGVGELIFDFFYYAFKAARWIGGILWDVGKFGWNFLKDTVAPAMGADPRLMGVVGLTTVAWATLNLVVWGEGGIKEWMHSFFYSVFTFMNAPFNYLKGVLTDVVGIKFSQVLSLLFLPLEVGMFLLSLVVGVALYPILTLAGVVGKKVTFKNVGKS